MQHCHPAIRPLTYSVRVRWDALLREWVDCHSAVFFDFGDKLELDESSIVRWARSLATRSSKEGRSTSIANIENFIPGHLP